MTSATRDQVKEFEEPLVLAMITRESVSGGALFTILSVIAFVDRLRTEPTFSAEVKNGGAIGEPSKM